MTPRTRREGGAYRNDHSMFEWSKLCGQSTDVFYQFCYWQLPSIEQHNVLQCWPFVQGWHEARPREYNS